MSTPPFPQWTDTGADAAFTEPVEVVQRANKFERTIHSRNRREYVAGWLGIALSLGMAALFVWTGQLLAAGAVSVLAAGFAVVMRNLHKRASNLERFPEEPCVEHLKRQYRHQSDALSSVATWYVGPLLPGFLAMQAERLWGNAQSKGWEFAIDKVFWPFTFTCLVVVCVIVLNLWAARDLKRKLDALDAID